MTMEWPLHPLKKFQYNDNSNTQSVGGYGDLDLSLGTGRFINCTHLELTEKYPSYWTLHNYELYIFFSKWFLNISYLFV